MGYVLVAARGRKQGLTIPVRRKVFVIGSDPASQLRSCRPGVGRRHCALVVKKQRLYLADLASGHPTLVNGVALTPGARLRLRPGDRVGLGPMEFVVETRKSSRRPAPVAAPFGAPRVPVGRPATLTASVPSAVPLAFHAGPRPPRSRGPSGRASAGWSAALLGVLAVVGLGGGVLLSRLFVGEVPGEARQTADADDRPGPTPPAGVGPEEKLAAEGKKDPPRPPEDKPKPPPDERPNPKPDDEPKPPDEKPKPPEEKPKPKPPPEERPGPPAGQEVTYTSHVMPLLKERCYHCHEPGKTKGGLDLTSRGTILKGGESGPAVVAGMPEKSPLFRAVDEDTMPPGKPLSAAQKKLLEQWISQARDGKLAAR